MSAISRFFDWIFFAEVQKQSLPKKEPRWWTQMIAAGLFVVVVLLAVSIMQYNFVKSKFPVSEDVARFGISGDFFGFSNAVFSALAFSTIIVTLWMQKHELRQQRLELDQTQDIMSLQINEMELQRQEMLQQRQEMQDQNESLRRQRFENTFFGMLELHNQVVSGVASPVGGSSGRAAFSMFLSALREINRNQLTGQQPALKENVDLLNNYDAWYKDNESAVGHYFRTLYNIIRYVHESGGPESRTYSRLIRAQLSSNELELLLYNGLSSYGKSKFKPLIEQYSLLKHVRQTEENKRARDLYLPSAFGSLDAI